MIHSSLVACPVSFLFRGYYYLRYFGLAYSSWIAVTLRMLCLACFSFEHVLLCSTLAPGEVFVFVIRLYYERMFVGCNVLENF